MPADVRVDLAKAARAVRDETDAGGSTGPRRDRLADVRHLPVARAPAVVQRGLGQLVREGHLEELEVPQGGLHDLLTTSFSSPATPDSGSAAALVLKRTSGTSHCPHQTPGTRRPGGS